MVVALSYVLAVIMTVALAICLYPIAAMFWVFGLLGKVSDGMFKFTKHTIAALWKDLKKSEQSTLSNANQMISAESTWLCTCGCQNTGKFCSECGTIKPVEVVDSEVPV